MPTLSSSVSTRESNTLLASKLTKSCYRDDQQAKFMNLQEEVDSLLQQLQNLKRQRVENCNQGE
jgi:hypothetical protein